MFSNYLRIALRSLGRRTFHSFISISGLAIGIACSVIISLFLLDETSYDKYHKNSENIYRIAHKRAFEGSFRNIATTPLYLGEILKSDFSSIEKTVRFMQESGGLIKSGNELFPEQRFCFADKEILEVFDINLKSGEKRNALDQPTSMLLSESMVAKYFPDQNPIGETVIWANWGREYTFQISGVFEDIPSNSHFQFDFFVPYDSPVNLWKGMHGQDWHYSGAWTYIQLATGQDLESVQNELNNFVKDNFPVPLNTSTEFYLQPLTDIYLHSDLGNEILVNGNITNVYIFSIIALLILAISCINFINLSTAKALTRSKEVGVRKALGVDKKGLIYQFLFEAVFIGFLASTISLVLIYIALPFFNQLASKSLSLHPFYEFSKFILVPIAGILVGLVAGLYPALFLSGFNPIKALKSSVYSGVDKGLSIRRGLVTFQFTISVILLVGISAITKQLNFLKGTDLGFDQEQIVFLTGHNFRQYPNLKNELSTIPGISAVSGGNSMPGSSSATPIIRMAQLEGSNPEDRLEVQVGTVDYDYLELLNLEIIDGRNFSTDIATDASQGLIVNEAFLKQSGIESDPIGAKVAQYDMLGNYANTKTIIGVLKDFHMESLHTNIKPLIYNTRNDRHFFAVLKVSPEGFFETINQVEEAAKNFSQGGPINLSFLDQDIERLYAQEDRLSKLITTFTFLAIFISCLGLLGLASFTMSQRAKEVGIRKVLGASLFDLLALLTKNFTIMVLISIVIGAPLAYFIIDSWLNNFAYRISPGVEIFLSAGIITILITWLTIGYQSLKAAFTNPINALRDE